MSRATDSVRNSVRYSRNYNEQDEHQSQSVENRNYFAMSEVEGRPTQGYQQQSYGSTEYDQRRGIEQTYIRQTPQPKPRQVSQQQNRGTIEQYPTYGYSQANGMMEKENKSKFMNEVYKTASPGTSSVERQDLIEEHTWTPNGKENSGGFPWFTIIITIAQTAYFFYMYWTAVGPPSSEWALWQSEFNDNKLILDGDKATIEKEVWRFFSYSFVHSGWQHLIGNMMMQLIVGSLLEIVHGTIRIMVIYVIGVIVGGITAVVITPNIHLVGASGGDFCLVTTVLAGVVLNCDSMNIVGALIRVLLFGGYIVAEGYMSIQRYNDGDHQISWAAHLGGAVTGLLIGTVVLRNMDIKKCENVCRILSLLLFIGYLGVLTTMWFLIVDEENDINDGIDVIKSIVDKDD